MTRREKDRLTATMKQVPEFSMRFPRELGGEADRPFTRDLATVSKGLETDRSGMSPSPKKNLSSTPASIN